MYFSTAQHRGQPAVQALAERLFRERYTYLVRIATKNAMSQSDAAEALQFAFLAFLQHFDPSDVAPPLAWLTLTLKRECWAKHKRQHLDRRAAKGFDDGSDEPQSSHESIPAKTPDTAARVEQRLEARRRLARLKPAER